MKLFLIFILAFVSCFPLYAQEEFNTDLALPQDLQGFSEYLETEYNIDITPTQIQDRLTRIVESTVRVSVSGGVGTGTVYYEDEEFYYILTNAHVVGNSRTAGLEFVKNHYPSPRYVGEVEKKSLLSGQAFDVAVIKLKKSSLPAWVKLPVMEIAGPNDNPRTLLLITCGCQAGEMPSVQLTVTTRHDDKVIYYLPTSRPGRSGSSLVDIEGNKIHGLVAWMTGQGRNSQGLAMTAERIRPWIFNKSLSVSYMSDFPKDAKEIPLASDSHIEAELESFLRHKTYHPISSNNSEGCEVDSCLDGECPGDYPGVITEVQEETNRWLRRFGPLRNQPRPQPGPQQPRPPTQPSPQQPQPKPLSPSDPWATPPSEPKTEPSQPNKPSDPRSPWAIPPKEQPPVKPEIQPKPDLIPDASKIDLILHSLTNNVEPTLNTINSKLENVDESNREQGRLFGRLRDRLDSAPSPQIPRLPNVPGPQIDPKSLADRISEGIFGRIWNMPIIADIRWFIRWTIYITLAIVGVQVMQGLFGAAWISVIISTVFGFIKQIVSIITELFKSLFSSISSFTQRPAVKVDNSEFEELKLKFEALLKSQEKKDE